MPHQLVKDGIKVSPGFLNRRFGGIFSGNYLNGLAASSNLFGHGSEGMFTNLLKTNFLNKSVALDQNPLANLNTNTQNLNLSDQFSRSMPVTANSRRLDFPPAVLSVAALNINLSSLGPFYASAGTGHSKDTNSSSRASRAASPALGNPAENNRLNILDWNFFFCDKFVFHHRFGCFRKRHSSFCFIKVYL